ncbi:MAG: glycosyltransferase family 2 protein [Chlorobiaceae bacterium]|nr:glycosyltransferase family 2 protein [Chlorobiaceae bacterium]
MNISVVIPLYNKRDTIWRTIDSVLEQTYPAQEIIVVDDGSTDSGGQGIEEMNIPTLRMIRQDNAGVSAARNRGYIAAMSEWVAFIDGDDEWHPDFLKTISEMAVSFPGYEVYATAYLAGDDQGYTQPIRLNKLPFDGECGVLENYFDMAACSDPPLWSSALCVQREALELVGGFPLHIRSGEDLLTWARLAARKPPVYCTRPLAVFWQDRAHTYDEKPNRLPEPEDPVGKALERLKNAGNGNVRHINRYLSMWHKMRSSIYLRLGFHGRAFMEALKGIYHHPSNSKLYAYLMLCFIPTASANRCFKRFGR